MNLDKIKNLHFVGIGGIGMRGIAEILTGRGMASYQIHAGGFPSPGVSDEGPPLGGGLGGVVPVGVSGCRSVGASTGTETGPVGVGAGVCGGGGEGLSGGSGASSST